MRFFTALLLLLSVFAHADESELLEPEQAFKFSARVIDANTLEVRYQIADGYYLYRDKLKFEVQPATVTLGTPQFPAGQIKQDETFGKSEVYHHEVNIRLPLIRTNTSAQTISLKSISQGCAEGRVCYSPIEQRAELKLAALTGAPASASTTALAGLQDLGAQLGGANNGFLQPDEAF